LVKTLPPDDRNLDISQASVDLFMIVAYINESFAGEVAQNSIIECMALEVFADTDSVEWSDGTGTATPLPDDSNINLRRELHTTPNAAILYERAAAPQDLILQRSAPNHLQYVNLLRILIFPMSGCLERLREPPFAPFWPTFY
jgi:hypothetical protein